MAITIQGAVTTLQDAIHAWAEAAASNQALGHHATADLCARTVAALERERQTGIAVCSCCQRPWAQVVH